MSFFQKFLASWEGKNPGTSSAIQESTTQFVAKLLAMFDYRGQTSALLLGHVQSGKTSQILATISSLADKDFKLFIVLTSDMTSLQEQTLKRAFNFLPREFNICDETDDMRFIEKGIKDPTILVLKKNSRVLRKWKRKFESLDQCKYDPMVFLDDEADAASLNTKINQRKFSTINRILDEMKEISPSSIYIQVTATPQAILLQTKRSGWKPTVIHAFEPGTGYRGGNHFYGESSKCIRPLPEAERLTLIGSEEIPSGLKEAILSFLINDIYTIDYLKRSVCNLLVHPGSKIEDHDKTESKIKKLLKTIPEEFSIGSQMLKSNLFQAYEDINQTCEDLPPFNFFWSHLPCAVRRIRTQKLNSETIEKSEYDTGSNILIGGNATGRGITFPGLQVVYYCRESKSPQADTLWQHSRIFGYDRKFDACRVFLPTLLLRIFRSLNESNDALFGMLAEHGLDQITLLQPEGVSPTRKNVLDQRSINPVVGDCNRFFEGVSPVPTTQIDSFIRKEDREEDISIENAIQLLEMIDPVEDFDRQDLRLYINCLKALQSAGDRICHLIVRTDRDITRETGSLLSQNDRQRGSLITDRTVLTIYRVNGQVDKGWTGSAVWVPNIKFPKGRCFYSVV